MSEPDSPLGGAALDTAAEEVEVQPEPAADYTETPPAEPEVPAPPQPAEPAEPEVPAEPAKPSPNFSRDVTRLIRQLSDTNPDQAALLRQIREAVFRDMSMTKHFETPEAAQRARASFDAIGGEQGLAQLQESAEAIRQIDAQAASGSPELIDAWLKESPEGFLKAAPYALQKIEQLNPGAYNKMLAPHFIRALWSTGIGTSVDHLEWYANQLANEGLSREVAGLRQWLNEVARYGQQSSQQENDPRAAEFREQQEQLARDRVKFFEERIKSETQPHLERSMEESLRQHDTRGILKDAARLDMLQAIFNEVTRTLANDSVYQANLAALKQKGNVDEVVRYIRASVDAVRGRAAREVWLRRAAPFTGQPRQSLSSPAAAPAPRPAAGNGRTPPTTPQPIPRKPHHLEIDWDRDPTRDHFIAGRAYLKNGRFVTWRSKTN